MSNPSKFSIVGGDLRMLDVGVQCRDIRVEARQEVKRLDYSRIMSTQP